VATPDDVEETLRRLIRRFERLEHPYKSMLPARRTVEAEFPDLDVVYHAVWRDGHLSDLHAGPAAAPEIRVVLDSDDLLALADGDLAFRRAYATNRVHLDASMSDLLRLRTVL
jgi:hypothetical protein